MKTKMLLYLMLIFFVNIYPKIWRVDVNSANKPDFTSLTEALNAISAGDTIYLASGNYGNITINKKVTIIGIGYFLDQNPNVGLSAVPASIGRLIIDSTATGSIISSLQISANNLPVVSITADNVVITRCLVTSERDFPYRMIGIEIIGSNCTIEKSYINFPNSNPGRYLLFVTGAGFTLSNSVVFGGGGRVVISNGYIMNNVFKCHYSITNSSFHNNILTDYDNTVANTLTGEITYNISHGNISLPDSSYLHNQNNVDMGSVFVGTGSNDGKYMLKENSPARGAGMGGTDCGIFGGSSPYVLSGVPPMPVIYYLDVPTTGTTTEGLPISIKVRSQK